MTNLAATPRARFRLRRTGQEASSLADDVRRGLTAVRKVIPPRYFYDPLGSALFEAITELPEYYLTRTERTLLTEHGREIAEAIGAVGRVVELGSGTARKSRLLLEQLLRRRTPLEYVPVDVDASILERCARELLADQPGMTISAIAADFRQTARYLGELPPAGGPTCVLFLGSTIGNLEMAEAVTLLRHVRGALETGDRFLLGADMKKPKAILDAAYNDALGVTAAFNRNLLERINRELGGHFDVRTFQHLAYYDEALGRVEMHLVSLRDQTVPIDRLGVEPGFAEGESIHTENSYKYDQATLAALTAESGFELTAQWTDAREWFATLLLTAR